MATYQSYTEYSNMQGGGFESGGDSRPGTSDSSAVRKMSTLTPVTIKQILESTQEVQDGPFVSHGQELHHISFVGVVRNITDHTSNIYVTVEDGSGQIEVRKWSDDASDMSAPDAMEDSNGNDGVGSQIAQQFTIGTYVKVYGALKEFSGKKNIQYAVIKNVESFNDVLTHHLEAIKWHAISTGKLPDPTGVSPLGDNATSAASGGNSGGANSQGLFVKDAEGKDVAPTQLVLDFCKQQCRGKDANSFAVPMQLISQNLNIDEETVRNVCGTLTEQGFIYPTFDDTHFFAL